MATNFEQDFVDTAWVELLVEHGESITYTPDGGSPSSFSAIFTETSIDEIYADGEDEVRTATLEVARSDVTAPAPKDQATINGLVWVVMSIQAQDDGTSMLNLEYVEQVAVFRDGHQRDR